MLAGKAAEGGAIVAGARGEAVEHFREAVRSRLPIEGTAFELPRPVRCSPDNQRQDQDGEHGHLDFLGLDLLADISGVRPTMSPATKTETMTNSNMP